MVRKIHVEIEGISSLLQHKMLSEKSEIETMKKLVNVLKKDNSNEEAYTKEAELSLYKDKEGRNCIPSIHIERALVKAGVNEQVAGRGKKTYKDYMNAFVSVTQQLIPITPQEYELNRCFVKVMRARIMRTRPEFPEGWKASFDLLVVDDTIPIDTIKNILDFAGAYVGIGDWRPKFGRFQVLSFEEQK